MNSKILYLLFSKSNNYVIFFGYSPFQINIIDSLVKANQEFCNSKILLFDFNKSINGRKQFKNACLKFKSFVEYNKLSIVNLIKILILIRFRKIKVIHGNYNTISFKILSKIHSNYLYGLDDGSNSLLMPFRIKNKFKRFFTIFPSLKACNNLSQYAEIVEIKKVLNNKIEAKKNKYNDVYICGSADVEEGLVDEEIYSKMISRIVNHIQNYSFKKIFYYPHRRESIYKIRSLEMLYTNNSNLIFKEPLVSFDDYYEINNLNACLISLTSTLEMSLEFKLDHNNFLIKPIRYSPNDINKNYSLDYAIISSSLSSKFSREQIMIYLNNKLINNTDFLKNRDFVDSSMTNIHNSQIINMVGFSVENKKIQKWKGHPILISDKPNILRWKNIPENYKLINYLKIAPELIIGRL